MTAPVVMSPASPVRTTSSTDSKPGVANPAFSGSKVDPTMLSAQNVKVAIRIRPLVDPKENENNVEEDADNSKKKKPKTVDDRAWNLQRGGASNTLTQKGVVRKVEGRSVFQFDQIFDEDTLTPLLHQSITRPMVKSVLFGQHATVFAYGQTGSGKTFTMQGDGKVHGGRAGVIQLVASDLFRFMRQGTFSKREYEIKVSYIEIYNEKVRDLLSKESSRSAGSDVADIQIRTTAAGDVVLNCTQTDVSSVDEVLELLIVGNNNRVVAKTDMNEYSSRSHAIFRLSLESREKKEGQLPDPDNDVVRHSVFNLVDLAGSESVKAANTTGERQREGGKINQSLLSLSTVIHSLSLPENKRPRHINYRDSKITRILQPHLQGNAEMAILCCISPSKQVLEETRSTLKFASRAKLVMMTPKVNEVLDDSAKIKKLEAELAAAKKELEELKKVREEASFASSGQQHESLGMPVPPTSLAPGMRKYVMPKNQTLPQGMGMGGNGIAREYLQSHSSSGPDSESFKIESADPAKDENAVFRYTDDNMNYDAGSKSDESGQEISGISEVHSFDLPIPGTLDRLQPDSFDLNSSPEKSKRFESLTPTLRTEAESTDGPEATYADVSLKFASDISSPDSLGNGSGPANKSRTQGSRRDGGRDVLSWDNLDINTIRRDQIGRPLQALRSLSAREGPIPTEITIIASPIDGEGPCLTDRIEETEARAEFFEMKLEDADDLIEALFKDLERARLCVHDLVFRNVKLSNKLKQKRREDIKEEYQEGEVVMEQYWLLKGAMYVGLFFFFTGGYEFFMATVILIWLILEANLTAAPS